MRTSRGYNLAQIALHWAILLFFMVNYLVSDEMAAALRAVLNGATPAGLTPVVHVWTGVAMLVLVLLRIAIRLIAGVPAESASGMPWMRVAARYSHLGMYVLMLAVPMLGASAWFLGFAWAGGLHELAVNIMLLLILLHAASALFHQLVLKDGLMNRMLRPS